MERGVGDVGEAAQHEALQPGAGGEEREDSVVGDGGAGLEVENLYKVAVVVGVVVGSCQATN